MSDIHNYVFIRLNLHIFENFRRKEITNEALSVWFSQLHEMGSSVNSPVQQAKAKNYIRRFGKTERIFFC